MGGMSKLHILGIAGTFMGGVAALARELGWQVEGSDQAIYPPMSTQLETLGIALAQGYAPSNISPDATDVVVGNALSRGNPAVEAGGGGAPPPPPMPPHGVPPLPPRRYRPPTLPHLPRRSRRNRNRSRRCNSSSQAGRHRQPCRRSAAMARRKPHAPPTIRCVPSANASKPDAACCNSSARAALPPVRPNE